MIGYSKATAQAKAIIAALKCERSHPLSRIARRILRSALKERTKREAAAIIGMHETRLSELLRNLKEKP